MPETVLCRSCNKGRTWSHLAPASTATVAELSGRKCRLEVQSTLEATSQAHVTRPFASARWSDNSVHVEMLICFRTTASLSSISSSNDASLMKLAHTYRVNMSLTGADALLKAASCRQ